jgi:hypothetical protein
MNCAEAVKVTHYPVEGFRKQVTNTNFAPSKESDWVIRVNPRKSAANFLGSKNKCGRGQPPQPHRSWFPVLPLSPHGGG